jgi:hypothetical protein
LSATAGGILSGRWRGGFVASFRSHIPVRAEIGDEGDGSEKERIAMTPLEILKALSQGHGSWG